MSGLLDFGDVAGLRALRAVNDLELHCLAFFERSEAVALDGRVVHEDIAASVTLDETVPLGVVEALDLACDAHRSLPTCCDATASVVDPGASNPGQMKGQKKRPQVVCGLSLSAPGPPGVRRDNTGLTGPRQHAQSVAQRFGQNGNHRTRARPFW